MAAAFPDRIEYKTVKAIPHKIGSTAQNKELKHTINEFREKEDNHD